MIESAKVESAMKKIKRKFTLRTAVLTAVTVALVASATVFMAVGAEGNVTPSDVSPTTPPSSHHSGGHSANVSHSDVSSSDVSPSDGRVVMGMVSPTEMLNYGDPVATMTTTKGVGSEIALGIVGENVLVDYGDGTPVEFDGHPKSVQGSNIKIYGNNISQILCPECQLTTLDVSACAALKVLWCHNNKLTSLALPNSDVFEELTCYQNNLTSLAIAGCTSLKELNCHTNNLSALKVSSNTKLTYLCCSHNPITSLDVSKNAALVYLICQNIQLTRLDVTKNTNLEVLMCDDSEIGSIDLSKNSNLREFQCCCCNLSDIDVSNNTELKFLCFNINNVTEINLSQNANLETLKCNGNTLTSLDLSHNPALTSVECDYNNIPFSGFKGFNFDGYNEFTYAPQGPIQIPATVTVGESINLSSEASVGDTATVFTWYDEEGNVIAPATANGGVFTFGEDAVGKTLVCKMANAKLPDFKADADQWADYNEETQQDIYEKADWRLSTTEVTVEGDTTSSDTTSSDTTSSDTTSSDTTSSDNNGDDDHNNGNDGNDGVVGTIVGETPKVPYFELTYEENDAIEDFEEVEYPLGTKIEINGKVYELGAVPGVKMVMKKLDDSKKKSVLDAIADFNKNFDTNTNNISFYDISLQDSEGEHVEISSGHVLMCLKYPEDVVGNTGKYEFHLYHQKEDGTVEEIPLTVVGSGLWFTSTDYSPYVLCWNEKKVNSAGTGESVVLINAMAILLFFSAISINIVLYRRRKQINE